MTAKETIEHALGLTPESSMLELAQAETNLLRCNDLVVEQELIPKWMAAWQHVEQTKSTQDQLARTGAPVRIM